MSVTRFITPFATALDAVGVTLPGAKLYFYLTGTATPQNTYSNSTLTTPNTNPVVADAGGLFSNIYLIASAQYKVVLTDQDGNQIWTADPVESGVVQAATAATIANIAALRTFAVTTGIVNLLVYVRGYYTDNDGGEGFFQVTNVSPGADNGGIIIWSNTTGFYYVRQTDGLPYTVKWFGAIGDGVTDDTAAVTAAVAASAARLALVNNGTYRITAALTPALSTVLHGEGSGSIIKTTTVSTHLVDITASSVRVEDLALVGTNGSAQDNNSGVMVRGANHVDISGLDVSGMSGAALYAREAAFKTRFTFNYVHDLAGSYTDSSDIALYLGATYCLTLGNYLNGGSTIEVGLVRQLGSYNHKSIGDWISDHSTYGMISYENTPAHTYNLTLGATIENIAGTTLSGNSGAGIYDVSAGRNTHALCHIRNTNISTTTESLAPGAIGIATAFSPELLLGNMITQPNWYGILVVGCTDATIQVANNDIFEPGKTSVYVKASNHTNIQGGAITQLTAGPNAQRGVAVNIAGGGPFTGVSVCGQRIRGTGVAAIDIENTNNVVVSTNNISETAGHGIKVANGSGAVITGNVVDVTTAATSQTLIISDMINTTISGNVLESTSATCVSIVGTCTNTVFDRSNILVGMDMNNIDNTSDGCIVETYGAAAPTLLHHQVGDKVWYRSIAAGAAPGTVCTTAGVPGTWKAMASVAA